MSLGDLIPKIELGKKYLWKVRVTEMVCPSCGAIAGMEGNGLEEIVTIDVLPQNLSLRCENCDFLVGTNLEGWYGCRNEKGELYAVPYSQLQRIT